MNDFWDGETYKIVSAMKASGYREGLIARWKAAMASWARMNRTDPAAQAVLAWIPFWQPRPFYTVQELAPIWPALSVTLGFADKLQEPKSPERLGFELDYAGLPWLQNKFDEPKFLHPLTAERHHFYIVERVPYWSVLELTQEDFEREFFDARD
jgi:hypothetical protein